MLEQVFGWIDQKALDAQSDVVHSDTYEWLVCAPHVTEHIRQRGSILSLRMMSESFEEPYLDEQLLLQQYQPVDTPAFVRCVCLYADSKPLEFARVVVPFDTYKQYEYALSNLGSQPIGDAFLYRETAMVRSAFEYQCIGPQHAFFQASVALHDLGQAWARRSVFTLPKGSLMISEMFLI